MENLKQNRLLRGKIFFALLSSLVYSVTGKEYSPKPFQFRCYDNDVCTWPTQYCSSETHERRCVPCLTSVCNQATPPHQCQYNCSSSEQAKDGADITNAAFKKDDCSFVALGVVSTFCAVLVIVVLYLSARTYKLREKLKKKENKIEEMQSLIKAPTNEHDASIRHKDEGTRREFTNQTDSYAEKKLKQIPPTKDSSSPGQYKPTTYMNPPPTSD